MRALYTVREFCWRNSIGKTKFFELVKANALHVVRLDGRLMIPADSEKEWIASLPSARCGNPCGNPGTHRMFKSPEYWAWAALIQRCTNENREDYKLYGGRGIKVCERWLKFANFYADMGPKPSSKHSIHRLDNNQGYFPENCRWATPKEQAANRRPTSLRRLTDAQVLEIRASSERQSKLCKKYGVGKSVLSEIKLHKAYKHVL